jgi:hypothetical protein
MSIRYFVSILGVPESAVRRSLARLRLFPLRVGGACVLTGRDIDLVIDDLNKRRPLGR